MSPWIWLGVGIFLVIALLGWVWAAAKVAARADMWAEMMRKKKDDGPPDIR